MARGKRYPPEQVVSQSLSSRLPILPHAASI